MIAIVTDSACDLPSEYHGADDLFVVPALVNIGQQTLRDGIDISREMFYNLLPTLPDLPSTSAPSPALFIDAYEQALAKASDVVAVITASELSGLFNAARLAAGEVAPERIHLIDSGQVSMGLGWAALAGLEAARRSEPLEAVINSVRGTIARVRLYAVLNSVEYLAKSGRVSLLELGLSHLLSVKLIVELREGVVSSRARVRTWPRAMSTLADHVRSLAPVDRLAVMHTNYVDGALDLRARVKDMALDSNQIVTTNATTVIGAHVGPGAVGVAAVMSRARK